jgi:hypothetical protein
MPGITLDAYVSKILIDQANQALVQAFTDTSAFWRFLQLMGRIDLNPMNDSGPQWQVQTAGSTAAESFAEGTDAGQPGQFEHESASLSFGQYQHAIRIGGKSRDILARGDFHKIANYLLRQTAEGGRAIAALVDAHLRGTGEASGPGLTGHLTAASDTGTYAGLDRAIFTVFQAYIDNVGGVLTEDDLDAQHTMMTETIGGNYTHIIGADSTLQVMKTFDNIAKQQVITGPTAPQAGIIGFGGMGEFVPQYYYKQRPVIAIQGWLPGRLDFIDFSSPEGPMIEIYKGLTLDNLAKTGDDDRMNLTYKLQYKIENPRKRVSALTGIT